MLDNPDSKITEDVRRLVREEMNKLSDSKYRIPWEDGLPEIYLNLLEFRKAELDTLYNPVVNPVEMNKIGD